MSKPRKRADVFVASEDDPREGEPTPVGERAMLVEYLRYQCPDAGAEALGPRRRRPGPPLGGALNLSLLGLVRHMAEVERTWFRRTMAGQDAPPLFRSDTDPDGDFDGARPDPEVVDEAWRTWRAEIAFAARFVADAPDLEITGPGG
jgi:hypothetical protein